MKQSSSKWTSFMKRGIPILWLVTSIVTFTILFFTFGAGNQDRLIVYLAMGASAITAGFIYKIAIADLADEVIDNGDRLIFHKDSLKQTVELRDIINIRRSFSSKNDKIIITVQSSGPIGSKRAANPWGTLPTPQPYGRKPSLTGHPR